MWPFSNSYPQLSTKELHKNYDYIIAGGKWKEGPKVRLLQRLSFNVLLGGTAGCVLARRLVEERAGSVLLIERGDARNGWLDRFPLLSTYQWSDRKHSHTAAARFLSNRTTEVVAGSGLGGTSRINGMQYSRGVPGQYNAWAQSGRRGWSYQDLQPYFERSESVWNPDTGVHYGSKGK
jgi:choline dehydrogenase